MAATIQTELKDNSEAWASALKKQFAGAGAAGAGAAGAGAAADSVREQFVAVGRELDGITNVVAPALASLPQLWKQTQDAVARTAAQYGEFFRIVPPGTAATLTEMRRLRDETKELEVQQVRMRSATEFGSKLLADIAKKQVVAREAEVLATITDEVELRKLQHEELKRIQSLIAAGKASEEDKVASAIKIEQIAQRQHTAAIERARKNDEINQKYLDDRKKEAEDLAKKEQQLAKETQEAEVAAIKEAQKNFREAAQRRDELRQQEQAAMLAQAKAEVELKQQQQQKELADFVAFLDAKKQGTAGQPLLESLGNPGQGQGQQGQKGPGRPQVQVLTPAQLRAIEESRVDAEWNNEKDAMKLKGHLSTDEKWVEERDNKGNRKKNQPLLSGNTAKKYLNKVQTQFRNRAKVRFRKDAVRGNISHTDVAQANNDVRDAALKKIESDGSLKEAELTLLKGLVNKLNEAERVSAAQEDVLHALVDAVNNGAKVPGGRKAGGGVP